MENEKQNVVIVMTADNGLKNLQHSDTKCWGQGRQCGRSNNILMMENLRMRKSKICTEREREREIGTKRNVIFQSGTFTNDNNNL